VKVLRGGAERGYACMDFSGDGDKLASVSTSPDYMLTIWDWQEESMGLHSKAFGQDVWNVKFSKDDSRRLTTSGIGHIRFWKMAATFTGLKLQGSIGKFGKVDLSDIEHFVELPDGKVISGTENGSLLLWEGNFIKCRFVQVGNKPCHTGPITFLHHDRIEKCIISASLDGSLRWWDFGAIDSAEVDSDHSMDFTLLPLAEYRLPENAGMKSVMDCGTHGNQRSFIIVDSSGTASNISFVWKGGNTFNLCDSLIQNQDKTSQDPISISTSVEPFHFFHSGAVTGIDTCPVDHLVATCGEDGRIFCTHYHQRKIVATQHFPVPASCLKWLPENLEKSGNTFAVGFSDGTVKLLTITPNPEGGSELIRRMVFKPHNAEVRDIGFSSDGRCLATTSVEGTVFFFQCRDLVENVLWEPLCFINLGKILNAAIYCEKLFWSPNDDFLLASCSDFIEREFSVSRVKTAGLDASNSSFEIVLDYDTIQPVLSVLSNAKSGILEIIDPRKQNETNLNRIEETTAESNSAPVGTQNELLVDTGVVPLKMLSGVYKFDKDSRILVLGGVYGGNQNMICEYDRVSDSVTSVPVGVYSLDGKEFLKFPSLTAIRYGWSRRYLSLGLSDGSVLLKLPNHMEIYSRYIGHDNTVTGTALSFDDQYIFSVGKDGCLVSYRIREDIVTKRGSELAKDLDAGIFAGQTVKERSKIADPSYLIYISSSGPEDVSFKNYPALSSVLDSAVSFEGVADLPPEAYSIQDNRLKLEEHAKKNAAEDLKGRVIASVKALRKDYEKIIQENDSVPESVRLSVEELAVDGRYFTQSEEVLHKAIAEVHLENAYVTEKTEKLLEKLKSRYVNGLLMEEFPLSTFHPPESSEISSSKKLKCTVWSLRITALNSNVKDIISQVKSQVRLEELKDSQQRSNDLAQKKALSAMDEMKSRLQNREDHVDKLENVVKEKISTNFGDKDEVKHESTVVVRRARRKERKDELRKHELQKPNEHEDDSRDVESIRNAERTIGDYKLKSAEDYEVPEDQRINALRKVRQMAMLEDSMSVIRLAFNEKFLLLRQLKREIIFNIRCSNARIREIDLELNQQQLSSNLWEPTLDSVEFPDDFDEVTAEELQEFISNSKDFSWERMQPHQIPVQSTTTGKKLQISKNSKTNSFEVTRFDKEIPSVLTESAKLDTISSCTNEDLSPENHAIHNVKSKFFEVDEGLIHSQYSAISGPSQGDTSFEHMEKAIPILKYTKLLLKHRMTLTNPSKNQTKLIEQRRIKLQFERQMIQKEISSTLNSFHVALDELRIQRHQITTDLKLAEFKLLTLYQEYLLLQTFEARDNLLQQKQVKNKSDEKDNYSLSYENKMKLESKLEEIQHWNEKLLSITNELKSVLPDSHPYYDILHKIFRKKVKRNKSHEDENENGEEEDEQSDDGDDGDEDDELEEVEDICPPGCDQIIFEKILDLREKKLDTEEVCGEINKNIEDLKRTGERLKQREKQIAKETQQTEYEVTQFQLQKQAALNQIKVLIPLRLSQIFAFENSGTLTGPTEETKSSQLEDLVENSQSIVTMDKRTLVPVVKMKSHALFSTK
jgi:WD40 repeat protein